MQIEFEEIPVSLAGTPAFCMAGTFELDDDGEIVCLWIEQWGTRRGATPVMIPLHTPADGLTRLFWHVLRPILRQRFASQISEHVNRNEPSWEDEHRIGSFEALGVQ